MNINVTDIFDSNLLCTIVPISTSYHDTDLRVAIRILFNRFGNAWYPESIQRVLHETKSK